MIREFITTRNIYKHFGGVQALKNVSISINRQEILCLVGENGSGKSTFIKVISGEYNPDSGEIYIHGKKYKKLHPIDAIREGVQVIYQDFSLFPNLTVEENLVLNAQLEKNRCFMNWRKVEKMAKYALEQIGVQIDLKKLVVDLSIADKQLVAISKALSQDAKLIIMDEPTTALTNREVDSLFRIIKQLQKEEISVIFISHKLKEVLEISDRIIVLRNGEKIVEGRTTEFNYAKLVYHMTGRELMETRYSYPRINKKKDSLLKVKQLSKTGKFQDISFNLYPGEIIGITGRLGSGKSELALSLFGLKPPDSGIIYIYEIPIKINRVYTAITNGIAYIPEDRITQGIFYDQSIERNIFISKIQFAINWLWIVNLKKAKSLVDRWIKNLQIKTSSSHIPIKNLSGGNQQKVVLAKWFAIKAKIFILNSPTVGVDVGSKMNIHQRIRELGRKGKGVVLISDDLAEIMQTCCRVFIMDKGHFINEFNTLDCNEEILDEIISNL